MTSLGGIVLGGIGTGLLIALLLLVAIVLLVGGGLVIRIKVIEWLDRQMGYGHLYEKKKNK